MEENRIIILPMVRLGEQDGLDPSSDENESFHEAFEDPVLEENEQKFIGLDVKTNADLEQNISELQRCSQEFQEYPGCTLIDRASTPGTSVSHGSGEFEICLLCLRNFSLLPSERQLDIIKNAFRTLSNKLNIPSSKFSGMWDFTSDFVPICGYCFPKTQRLFELEMQLTGIQAELENQFSSIKKAIVDSEERRDKHLTDERFTKWRALALKVASPTNVDKSQIKSTTRRGRGRPRKDANVDANKPEVAVAELKSLSSNPRRGTRPIPSLPEMVDVKPIPNFLASLSKGVIADESMELHEESHLPLGSASPWDPDWETVTLPKERRAKTNRVQKPPEKFVSSETPNPCSSDDSDSDTWEPEEPEVLDEDINGVGHDEGYFLSMSSDEISDSELSDLEDKPYRPQKKKRVNQSKHSSRGKTDSLKWRSDKRRNKLFFDHIEVHWINEDGILYLKCSECEHKAIGTKNKLSAKSNLRKHILREHLGTFTCSFPQCGKKYGALKELNNHIDAAHELKKTTCEICGKPFSFQTSLIRHSWSHLSEQERAEHEASGKKRGGRPVSNAQCETCGRSFKSNVYLQRHQLIHADTQSRLNHMCPMCGKLFMTISGLTYHTTTVHEKDGVDTTDWFGCPYCKKKFAKRHQLKKHMPVHTGETCCTCSICGKSFKSLGALRVHRSVHEEKRANPCPFCDKKFKRRHHLKRHCAIFHPGGTNLPQRPQNRLKGPGGSDGGPTAALSIPTVFRPRHKGTSSCAQASSSSTPQASVTTTTEEEATEFSNNLPLNLVNTFYSRQDTASPLLDQPSGQPGLPASLSYDYPYDFQNLIRF